MNRALPPPPPPPPPPSSLRKKKKTVAWISASILVVIILVATLFYFDVIPWRSKPENQGGIKITSGSQTQAVSASIDYQGGTVEVSDGSSPLHGLKIEVPEAATDEPISFDITYADVVNITGLPENASVAGKLINIATSGSDSWNTYKAFDAPVLVTLPYDPSLIQSNDLVRFYCYNNENNELDSAGFLYETPSNHTITFYTSSFSPFISIKLYFEYGFGWLFSMIPGVQGYSAETGFIPRSDGWFMPNWGSYLNPAGICAGMCCYAKWFYRNKAVSDWLEVDGASAWVGTGVNLYEKYREGNVSEWRDDATAIQLATRAQIAAAPIFAKLRSGKVQDQYESINISSDNKYDARRVALTWLHGMIVSHEPQIITLGTQLANGAWSPCHMVLTYRYANGRFEIYDPNYPATQPGNPARQIPFSWTAGFTQTYASGETAGSGNQIFNLFFAYGSKVYSSPSFFEQLYEAAEKQFKDDNVFPTVKLTSAHTTPEGTTPEDTDSDGVRDTHADKVTISGTITGGQQARIPDGWIFVSSQGIPVMITGDYPTYAFSVEVPLWQGDNEIILLMSPDLHTYWAGYLKDTVKCLASRTNFTITLTWRQNNTDLDLHVLEPTINSEEGRHIYYGNEGGLPESPFLDIDRTRGYGPEHYIAKENMTLPNYHGPGNWLYGKYQVRVQYYADHDEDENHTQRVSWDLTIRYLEFKVNATGQESWHDETKSGDLTLANTEDTSNFFNTNPSWSQIFEVEYPKPKPQDYTIPPPPQNSLPP